LVEPPVPVIPTIAFSSESRVARDERRGPYAARDQVEDEHPRSLGAAALGRVGGGNAPEADRPEPEEVDRDRHRVRGEVAAAGAVARAGLTFELLELLVADAAALVGSDGLPDVLDRHRPSAMRSCRHRTRVEDQARDVEPEHRHREPRQRLVAAADADKPVEGLAQADELDRVRDQLAADERGPHARRALGEVVGDRNRVELERRPTRSAHAGGDASGELALAEVAWHRPRPGRRDPDERLGPVRLVEPHRPQMRPRSRAARARDEIRVGKPLHVSILDPNTIGS
jgi:hypothetical protein